MHQIAALLVAERLNDLLREAEAERRRNLVRSAERDGWLAAVGRRLEAGLARLRAVLSGHGDRLTPAAPGPTPA